eukprot:5240031-Pyramimonas_sp.AAC.1
MGPDGLVAKTVLGNISIGQDVLKVEAAAELGRDKLSQNDGRHLPLWQGHICRVARLDRACKHLVIRIRTSQLTKRGVV